MSKVDFRTISALSRAFDMAGYSVAKFILAIKNESQYNGGKQENGELKGSKTYISRAVGCKSKTVERIFERLLSVDGGGNELLRAVRNEENPNEFCFQSEAARNSLQEMSEKREAREQAKETREQRREARKTEKQSREQETQPESVPAESEAFKEFLQSYVPEKCGKRLEAWQIWQENNLDALPYLAGCFSDFYNKGKESKYIPAAQNLLKKLVEIDDATRNSFNNAQKEKRADAYGGQINTARELCNFAEFERLKNERDLFLPYIPERFPIPAT